MTSRQAIGSLLGIAFFALGIGLLFVGQAYLTGNHPREFETKSPPAPTSPAIAGLSGGPTPSDAAVIPLLRDAFLLVQRKQTDDALNKVDAALQLAPNNADALSLRGSIYAEKKLWDEAAKDYEAVLQADSKNVRIQFNLAELSFIQKKYDEARPGFVALEHDPNMGDLATYKAFLCDLLSGHEDAAAGELDALNKVGSNASYYFANASWLLYHQKTEEARGWLISAANIYAPAKFRLYAASLISLGYIPLPPPPQH